MLVLFIVRGLFAVELDFAPFIWYSKSLLDMDGSWTLNCSFFRKSLRTHQQQSSYRQTEFRWKQYPRHMTSQITTIHSYLPACLRATPPKYFSWNLFIGWWENIGGLHTLHITACDSFWEKFMIFPWIFQRYTLFSWGHEFRVIN